MLINGKTPEEIKATLKRCGKERCKSDKADTCAYYVDCLVGATRLKLMKDALSLIERLEAKLARQDALLAEMGVRVPEEEDRKSAGGGNT